MVLRGAIALLPTGMSRIKVARRTGVPKSKLYRLQRNVGGMYGISRGAGTHDCCGARSGSLSRPAARVAGDAVRRGQVQAERRMKARISTSSPMEKV